MDNHPGGQIDAFNRKESGLFVPAGALTDGGDVIAQRMADALVAEVNAVTAWCKRWPKEKERPLGNGDVMDLCLARARCYLWDRNFTEQVYRAASINLGLVKTPVAQGKPSRQAIRAQRRAGQREGRPDLRSLPINPMDPAYGDATAQEAATGFGQYDQDTEHEQIQQAEHFDNDQQPLARPPEHQPATEGGNHVP